MFITTRMLLPDYLLCLFAYRLPTVIQPDNMLNFVP